MQQSDQDDRTAYEQLAQKLAMLDQPTKTDADGLWLTNWQGVRISLDMVLAFPGEQNQWTARIDLTFSYNVYRPFCAIPTRAVGIGHDRDAAIGEALQKWIVGTAPVLLSHIYGQCLYGADYAPDGNRFGIPGWNCITGPWVTTGTETDKAETIALVKETPLIASVRDLLARELDLANLYYSVVLYRATAGDTEFADVLINNRETALADVLKRYPLPRVARPDGFIAIREFILCVRPDSATSTSAQPPAG